MFLILLISEFKLLAVNFGGWDPIWEVLLIIEVFFSNSEPVFKVSLVLKPVSPVLEQDSPDLVPVSLILESGSPTLAPVSVFELISIAGLDRRLPTDLNRGTGFGSWIGTVFGLGGDFPKLMIDLFFSFGLEFSCSESPPLSTRAKDCSFFTVFRLRTTEFWASGDGLEPMEVSLRDDEDGEKLASRDGEP